MVFDPSPKGDPAVVISAVAHDAKCSASGTPPLERKYGTRAMMLGTVHATMFLARSRWPHLRRFELSDESTFACDAVSQKVRTFAVDLLLRDDTYYERHLNARPVREVVAWTAREVVRKSSEPVDAQEWRDCVHAMPVYDPQLASWVSANGRGVSALVDLHARSGSSWRALFTALSDAYGCAFFASYLDPLIEMFGMQRLLGASYSVEFADVPRADVASEDAGGVVRVFLPAVSGGGGAPNQLGLRKRMAILRARAIRDRIHARS